MGFDEPRRVSIRGQCVHLHRRDGETRRLGTYQGGDYFEFRHDAATGRWLLSRSAEDRLHDPANVVASGISIQDAANDFTVASHRQVTGCAYVPNLAHGCDMAAASIDTLVLVLGEAVRLGYHDARHHHPPRTANLIGDALGLVRWNGLQQLQLRHAYMAGREQCDIERIRPTVR